jgi:hypothetical protein
VLDDDDGKSFLPLSLRVLYFGCRSKITRLSYDKLTDQNLEFTAQASPHVGMQMAKKA